MHACVLQLLKTQEELEILKAEKVTSSGVSDDTLHELQQQNSAVISQVYVTNALTAICYYFSNVSLNSHLQPIDAMDHCKWRETLEGFWSDSNGDRDAVM